MRRRLFGLRFCFEAGARTEPRNKALDGSLVDFLIGQRARIDVAGPQLLNHSLKAGLVQLIDQISKRGCRRWSSGNGRDGLRRSRGRLLGENEPSGAEQQQTEDGTVGHPENRLLNRPNVAAEIASVEFDLFECVIGPFSGGQQRVADRGNTQNASARGYDLIFTHSRAGVENDDIVLPVQML